MQLDSKKLDKLLAGKDLCMHYVFLDVVGFTRYYRNGHRRTVCIDTVNRIIEQTLRELVPPDVGLRLIPTGDGVCVAISNGDQPTDLHIKIAQRILNDIKLTKRLDVGEKLEVRIGVSSGRDRAVLDVNGEVNFLGDGINTAARIMDFSSANQMTVSADTVKDFLFPLISNDVGKQKEYLGYFLPYVARDKHGHAIEFFCIRDSVSPRVAQPVFVAKNIYQFIASLIMLPGKKSYRNINNFQNLWSFVHLSGLDLSVPDWFLRSVSEFASGEGFSNRIEAVVKSNPTIRPIEYQKYIIMMCVVYIFSWKSRSSDLEEFFNSANVKNILNYFSDSELIFVKSILCISYLEANDIDAAEGIFKEINLSALSVQDISWIDIFISLPLSFCAAFFGELDTVERLLNVIRDEEYLNDYDFDRMPVYLLYGYIRITRLCIFEAPMNIGITDDELKFLGTFSRFFVKILRLVSCRKIVNNIVRVKMQEYGSEFPKECRLEAIAIQNRSGLMRNGILQRSGISGR